MKAYLELEETEKLENAATCLRDKLLIRVQSKSGCRVSEAIALKVEDIDFIQGTITIQHLKARAKLNCPRCNTSLAKAHSFCPKCGAKIDKPSTAEQEHRRIRTLPLDKDTLEMLQDYINRGGPVNRNGKNFIFDINRHRAWQIVRD